MKEIIFYRTKGVNRKTGKLKISKNPLNPDKYIFIEDKHVLLKWGRFKVHYINWHNKVIKRPVVLNLELYSKPVYVLNDKQLIQAINQYVIIKTKWYKGKIYFVPYFLYPGGVIPIESEDRLLDLCIKRAGNEVISI